MDLRPEVAGARGVGRPPNEGRDRTAGRGVVAAYSAATLSGETERRRLKEGVVGGAAMVVEVEVEAEGREANWAAVMVRYLLARLPG